MKVKAAETERLLAHEELLAARTLCDEKKNYAVILLKQSEQCARNLWNYNKNIELEFVRTMDQLQSESELVKIMWQTGIEADESIHILYDAEQKVIIADLNLKITEVEKKKVVD